MKIDSPYWNHDAGVCKKHWVQELPCPTCLETQDPDVTVQMSEIDAVFLEGEANLAEMEGSTPPTVKDFFPVKHADWLCTRITQPPNSIQKKFEPYGSPSGSFSIPKTPPFTRKLFIQNQLSLLGSSTFTYCQNIFYNIAIYFLFHLLG